MSQWENRNILLMYRECLCSGRGPTAHVFVEGELDGTREKRDLVWKSNLVLGLSSAKIILATKARLRRALVVLN